MIDKDLNKLNKLDKLNKLNKIDSYTTYINNLYLIKGKKDVKIKHQILSKWFKYNNEWLIIIDFTNSKKYNIIQRTEGIIVNIYNHYVITNKREMANVLKYLEYIDSERTNNNINRYNLNLIFSIKDYLIHYNEQKWIINTI